MDVSEELPLGWRTLWHEDCGVAQPMIKQLTGTGWTDDQQQGNRGTGDFDVTNIGTTTRHVYDDMRIATVVPTVNAIFRPNEQRRLGGQFFQDFLHGFLLLPEVVHVFFGDGPIEQNLDVAFQHFLRIRRRIIDGSRRTAAGFDGFDQDRVDQLLTVTQASKPARSGNSLE